MFFFSNKLPTKMKRRSFLKQTGVATTGILLFSNSDVTAQETKVASKNKIDLTPISFVSKKNILKGLILDFKTLQSIPDCQIKVKVKNNRLLSTTDTMVVNGIYEITTGFTNSCRMRKKLEIEITAKGYKPYQGTLFITHNGCDIHSNEWQYNQEFDPNQCPKNNTSGNKTLTEYNFHLVKA